MKRDPEQDLLPHCIMCDGRHNPQRQTCEDFRKERAERENNLRPSPNLSAGCSLKLEGVNKNNTERGLVDGLI